VRIASPEGYEISNEVLQKARDIAATTKSEIVLTTNPNQAAKDTDIIYTDVWTSMGQEAESEQRRKIFASYQINASLLSAARKDVIFMHPLPAHQGEEISAGLLDHPSSVVFDQAENRLHIQKALLFELFRTGGRMK
jgi:ornithine carbamoyltransferase